MSKTYNIRKLQKQSFSSQKEVPKYYLSYCQDKINTQNPNTNGWINIVKTLKMPLEDYDKSRILLAKLEHHKDIVVKIGDDESIRREYEYAKKLYKLKGFVKFICYFECNDDFLKYPDKERNYLCNGEGSRMKIIAMPYFELGSIGSYVWNPENIHALRTSIKHAIMTNISAFMHGFLHGDFHPGNVLLKKTKQSSIDYLFEEIGEVNIETNGIRTWIMDFENTREISAKNPRDIMDFYFDIQKFFTLLQDHRFIKNIDKSTTINIFRWVNKYMNSLSYPNMDFIMGIFDSIDKIAVI
jgi:serine/threonine protein kinase